MDSQLPLEEGFTMSRPAEDILPTPPLPPKDPEVPADDEPDLLDISGSAPDPLSEAVSRAISGDTEDLPDACWNIMDDVNSDSMAGDVPAPAPAPATKKSPRRIVLTLDSQGEFQRESINDCGDEDTTRSGAPPTQDDTSPDFPPPNQLALPAPEGPQLSWRPSEPISVAAPSRPQKRRMQESIMSLHGSTIVLDPPGTLAARITSTIGRVNFYCPVVEVARNGEPGFLQHDFPHLDIEEVPDPTPKEMGEERFCSIKELASNKVLRTVPRNDTIEFLLLVISGDSMYIPSISFFDLAIGRIEENVITTFPNLRPLHWTSTRWMGCGVLELALSPLLEEWRMMLSKMVFPEGFKLDTFPKASLLMGPDVTMLLKDVYYDYSKRLISHSLMYRNKAMRGNVRVAYSKEYGEHDLTRFGVSMHHWQMIYLSGDCVFMEFLSKHPVSHRFIVGPSTVVIKGGIRKPSFLDKPNTSFTWTRTTFTPALLEPVYSLSPTDPSSFKNLAAATAKLCLASGAGPSSSSSSSSQPPSSLSSSSSSSPPDSAGVLVCSSAPVRSSSSLSSSSSSFAVPSKPTPSSSSTPSTPSDPKPSAGKPSSVRRGPPLRKSASVPGPNAKPKSRAARLKSKLKKPCC